MRDFSESDINFYIEFSMWKTDELQRGWEKSAWGQGRAKCFLLISIYNRKIFKLDSDQLSEKGLRQGKNFEASEQTEGRDEIQSCKY